MAKKTKFQSRVLANLNVTYYGMIAAIFGHKEAGRTEVS